MNVNINDDITQVVKKVEPDVVAVVNYTTTSDFFTQQSQTQESDIGSGVYFYRNGDNAYIVTNNHVVQGGSKVEIVLNTNKQVRATVVGTDPYTDLAVLKVLHRHFQASSLRNLPIRTTFKSVNPRLQSGRRWDWILQTR
ncbi:hypothetical protein GCM10025858_12010 [Alicyclobacillus sacchari]|nr:hypothetical protein GCM10025858_12010 [Alicyclobacillus sacchari]